MPSITNKSCIIVHDCSSNIKAGIFFPVLAVAEGSIIGCQDKLKVYYNQIRIRAFLFWLLQNQQEIAENYLRTEIDLNYFKMQQALLPVDMSNFN